MSDLLSKAKEVALTWWLVVVWVFLFSIVSLCTSITSVFYGMRWSEIDTQDKIMAGFLVMISWGTTLMAFLNKAISRVHEGKLPIENGDTQLIQKTTVQAVRTTEVQS